MDKDNTEVGRFDWLWLVALVVVYTIAVVVIWDLFQWHLQK